MNHEDLGLFTLNTPMQKVRLTKCRLCGGQVSQGYFCKSDKSEGKSYSLYPCSPLFALICPRAKADKGV